jgi:lipoprotein-releasing system ATP-binding protein
LDLLAHLGVKEQAYKNPSQLSGGQRQRVAIARALANDPLVILADEPTGNLDSASSQNVRSMLQSLTRDMGKTVVAVTHDGSFASGADRRIGIVDGKINNEWRPA